MSTNTSAVITEKTHLNPIDELETFVLGTNWGYDRLSASEIVISLKGQYCEYHVTASWIEHSNILHFAFSFSVGLSKEPMTETREHGLLKLLSLMNESLQIGHFDLWREENAIIWRHGQMLENGSLSHDSMSYLFRLALDTCERNYPAFQFLLWAGHNPYDALRFVLFETAGEA